MRNHFLTSIFFMMLTMSSAYSETLPQSCNQYFSQVDVFFTTIENDPNIQHDMIEIRSNFIENKKQILAMQPAQQEQACKEGLVNLKELKRLLPTEK